MTNRTETSKGAALRANIEHLLDLLDEVQSDLEQSLEHADQCLAPQGREDHYVGTLAVNPHLTKLAATINAARGLAAAR